MRDDDDGGATMATMTTTTRSPANVGDTDAPTETFTFTPINAMRSLENVELSAERERTRGGKGSVMSASGGGVKRRMRGDGTGLDAVERREDVEGDAPMMATADVESDVLMANVADVVAARAEEDVQRAPSGAVEGFTFTSVGEEERRKSKTFWASGSVGRSDVKKATFAPLMHTNGLPPTPAVYNAVPWPSSIPLRERSPPRVVGGYADGFVGAATFATPNARGYAEQRANVAAVTSKHSSLASSLVMETLATTPNELAAQLAQVKREIAKRQDEAVEVSRVLRQLQREEADLYIRAAEIQRQILEQTSESQPFDLSIMPNIAPPPRNIETMVSFDRYKASPMKSDGAGAHIDDEPSTSKSVKTDVKTMTLYQKLDVRKALISVDFIDGPGGLSLLTASEDNCLRLWAPDSRKPAALMRVPRGTKATAIMNERVVCVGTDMGELVQVDIATGQYVGSLTHGEHAAPWSVNTLTKFGLDNDAIIAAAGAGGDIKIWDARAARGGGAPMVMYSHGATQIRSVSFAPDGRSIIAAASNDLRSFDLRMNGRSMRMNVAGGIQPNWMSVTHDISTGEAVTLSSAGDAHIWSATTPFPLSRTICGASAPRSSVIDITSNFMLCAKGENARALELMNFSTGNVVSRWIPDAAAEDCGAVSCVAVSSVGASTQPYGVNHIAAGTRDGAVLVFAP